MTTQQILVNNNGGLTQNANATIDDVSNNITTTGTVTGSNLSGTNTGDNATNTTSNSYADGKVSDSIADGVTTIAPSQNAVFDGLALKIDKTQNDITREPTGFDTPENVIVNYDGTARTITLTGTVVAYWRGNVVTALVSGWVSPAHDNTNGIWFLSYNGSTFVWSTTAWTFDQLQIAFVNFGTTDKFAIRECHGTMPWQDHKEFHEAVGTYLSSGGDLASYTLNSTTADNRRPTISAAAISDEDLTTTNPLVNDDLFTQMYLAGAGATSTFVIDTAEIVPVLAARPYYNQFTGGAWQQTLMSLNNYQAIWLVAIPACSSTTCQKYRFVWIQGQSQSGTLATIQGLTPASLNLGQLATIANEFVFIAKVIIRYAASNWVFTQVDKLSGSRYNQTAVANGNFLSAVTTDLSLVGSGTVADPLSVVYNIDGSGTTNELTYWVDSNTLGALAVATYPSLTELSYVKGVTSAIQTQLGNKSAKTLQVTPVTLASVNWTLVSGLYEYDYSNANITVNTIVDVIPANASISIVRTADVLPLTVSSAGSVKLYATNAPSGDITVTINITE